MGGGARMTDAVRKQNGLSGLSLVLSAWHDPAARILIVDLLAVLIAIVLPWSTSAVGIAAALWVIAVLPTLEIAPFLRSLKRPASAWPIAMVALALVGTLWSDASWGERLYAVGPTAKMLLLPLLLYHGERSPRGIWVFKGFLASCLILAAASWIVWYALDRALGRTLPAQLVSVGAAAAVGGFIYMRAVLRMGIPEARQVRSLVAARFGRA